MNQLISIILTAAAGFLVFFFLVLFANRILLGLV
jgi:hypothetical protein